MEITITSVAESYIKDFLNDKNIVILFYDIEDCGCGVNGVPILIVTSKNDDEKLEKVSTSGIPLYMYSKHAVFFDEQLKIDYVNNKLKLSSNNQVFSYNMAIKEQENLV